MKIKINRQKGGAYVASGSYGCVYKPTLPCDSCKNIYDKPCDNTEKVSKIMKIEDIKQELKEIELVDKIDPEGEYHIGNHDVCYNIGNISETRGIKLCGMLEKAKKSGIGLEKFGTLNYEYGGLSLEKMNMDYCYPDGLISFSKLFEGVAKFVENRFVHNDIRLGNIVYNRRKMKMKFIDFGLSTTFDEIIAGDHMSNIHDDESIVYSPWPYYLYLQHYVKFPPKIAAEKLTENYFEGLSFTGASYLVQREKVYEDIFKIMTNYETYKNDIVLLTPQIIDMYSMAIVLHNMTKSGFKKFKGIDGFETLTEREKNIYIRNGKPIPEKLSEEEKDKILEVSRNVKELITVLVRVMLSPIIIKDDKAILRITPRQAYNAFRNILIKHKLIVVEQKAGSKAKKAKTINKLISGTKRKLKNGRYGAFFITPEGDRIFRFVKA